nr:MAG TPA: hypothetical protein [Caudoviricetes sp.]
MLLLGVLVGIGENTQNRHHHRRKLNCKILHY